ncbi:unnamed protein product [Trifolium pratense]|uniref:Uncharacterized protein n=1 Tax=Trifolium pratense TaxID=57577 RepID=A0ACB0IVI0_TRIPR|nr:unnamed protein product [Trifolium pratense]
MGRSPCCDKSKVKRGSWSHEEDVILRNYLNKHGLAGNWITLPQKAGLNRCGKSCRLRWLNYLRPHIKLGGFTEEEDNIIFTLYSTIGSRWSLIAAQLPGRTDNDVKNHWNTKLKKRFLAQNSSTSNNIYTFSNTTSTATTSSDHFSSTLTFQPQVEQTFVFDPKQNTTCFDSYNVLDLDQTTINNINLPMKMESEPFYTGNILSSSCSTTRSTPTTKEISSAPFLEEQKNNHNQWFGYDHDDAFLHEFVLDDYLNHGPSSG